MADPATAEGLTGYRTGGISAFGSRRELPAHVNASLLDHGRIALNGGRRGLIVELASADVRRLPDAHVAVLAA